MELSNHDRNNAILALQIKVKQYEHFAPGSSGAQLCETYRTALSELEANPAEVSTHNLEMMSMALNSVLSSRLEESLQSTLYEVNDLIRKTM